GLVRWRGLGFCGTGGLMRGVCILALSPPLGASVSSSRVAAHQGSGGLVRWRGLGFCGNGGLMRGGVCILALSPPLGAPLGASRVAAHQGSRRPWLGGLVRWRGLGFCGTGGLMRGVCILALSPPLGASVGASRVAAHQGSRRPCASRVAAHQGSRRPCALRGLGFCGTGGLMRGVCILALSPPLGASAGRFARGGAPGLPAALCVGGGWASAAPAADARRVHPAPLASAGRLRQLFARWRRTRAPGGLVRWRGLGFCGTGGLMRGVCILALSPPLGASAGRFARGGAPGAPGGPCAWRGLGFCGTGGLMRGVCILPLSPPLGASVSSSRVAAHQGSRRPSLRAWRRTRAPGGLVRWRGLGFCGTGGLMRGVCILPSRLRWAPPLGASRVAAHQGSGGLVRWRGLGFCGTGGLMRGVCILALSPPLGASVSSSRVAAHRAPGGLVRWRGLGFCGTGGLMRGVCILALSPPLGASAGRFARGGAPGLPAALCVGGGWASAAPAG
ncbi:hypothetical protein HYH03_017824, partial [Edaphochlamys debaryana]